MRAGVLSYNHREGINPKGKEGTEMKQDYIETTMEWMVEQALAELEEKGEELPQIRYDGE